MKQFIPYPRDPEIRTRLHTGNIHAILDWIGVGFSILFPLFKNPYNSFWFKDERTD